MKVSYCVHCGKLLTPQVQFGDTYFCVNCIPRCVTCGISFKHTERKGEECLDCWEAVTRRKYLCVSCGDRLPETLQHFKRFGNFCVRCSVTKEQEPGEETDDLINSLFS